MSDTTELIHKLSTFNLSEIEGRIYLHLSESQPQPVLTLSRLLNIPRTTVYDAITKLLEKGLVERVINHKSTTYKASSLENFQKIINQTDELSKEMTSALKDLQSNLRKKKDSPQSTQVRYYQGPEGLRQMIWNCLKAKDEIVGYSIFGRVEVVGASFYQRFVDEFARRNLTDRVIANPTPRTLAYIGHDVTPGRHQLKGQNIRTIVAEDLYIAGDIMIYNNIYAVSYWQGGEVVGVELENADLVKHERSIFELLWRSAKPLK